VTLNRLRMPGGTSIPQNATGEPVVPASKKTPAAEGVELPRTRTPAIMGQYPRGHLYCPGRAFQSKGRRDGEISKT